MGLMRPRRFASARIGVVVVALLALGGVAYAATQKENTAFISSAKDIDGCVHPGGGKAHIWLPGHVCSGGWQNIQFAANTQIGATGPTGPTNPAATTVDGQTLTKLMVKTPTPASTTTSTTLYAKDGLTIVGQCTSGGDASLVANGPASGDSELTYSGYGGTGPGAFGGEVSALGSTSNVSLGPSSAGSTSFTYASSAGQAISGSIGYQSASSFKSYAGCAFFGTVASD
jgi:hypothetical protein